MIVKNEDVQAIIIKIRHSYIAVAIYCRKRWSTHLFFQWHDTCFASDAAHRIFSPFEVRRGEDLRRIARHFSFGRHFGCSIWGVVVLLGLLSGWTWYPYFCNKVQGDLWPLTFDLCRKWWWDEKTAVQLGFLQMRKNLFVVDWSFSLTSPLNSLVSH